jgi:hypothetical protein
MKFRHEFLPLMSKQAVGATMNARSKKLLDKISKDITYPTFYNDLADLVGVEINMG